MDIFSTSQVKDLISLLKVINNPQDNINLSRVISFDLWNFSWEDKLYLNKLVREKEISLWDAIDTDEKTKIVFQKIKDFIGKLYEKALKNSLWEIFAEIIKETKAIENLFIREFSSIAVDYIENNPEANLKSFVEYLEVFSELGGTTPSENFYEQKDAVQVMTVHSSKGLEFPYVFIISLSSRRFPSTEKEDAISLPDALMKEPLPTGDYHLQEERRLFYVAMTRACKKLYLTCIQKKGTNPSIFIQEIKQFVKNLIEENHATFPKEEIAPVFLIQKDKTDEEILSKFNFNEFSYTQLELYNECPLKYKYQYILRIPMLASPVFSYGNIMHSTLEEYYVRIQSGSEPSWEELEIIFDEKWAPKGFRNIQEIEKYKNLAKVELKNFFEKNKVLCPRPIFLEQKFKIDIDGVKIIGRIDRMDALIDENCVEIIDYKTGKPKDQKYVDKDLQLSVYAIACIEQFKLKPAILSFYYLKNNEKVSTSRKESDLNKTKEEIIKIVNKIKQKDFYPRNSSFNCSRCNYKDFCSYS